MIQFDSMIINDTTVYDTIIYIIYRCFFSLFVYCFSRRDIFVFLSLSLSPSSLPFRVLLRLSPGGSKRLMQDRNGENLLSLQPPLKGRSDYYWKLEKYLVHLGIALKSPNVLLFCCIVQWHTCALLVPMVPLRAGCYDSDVSSLGLIEWKPRSNSQVLPYVQQRGIGNHKSKAMNPENTSSTKSIEKHNTKN